VDAGLACIGFPGESHSCPALADGPASTLPATPQEVRLTDAVQYLASFPATLTDDAGRRFRDYVYRHMFGWQLALCGLINLIACVAFVALLGRTTETILLCALMGVSATYFTVNYATRRRVTSRRLIRAFGDGATVTLRPDGFELQVGSNTLSRPWGRQRAILESDQYFLLVILPTICLVLPREGMPAEGMAWIRAAMAGPMTRSRLPGF